MDRKGTAAVCDCGEDKEEIMTDEFFTTAAIRWVRRGDYLVSPAKAAEIDAKAAELDRDRLEQIADIEEEILVLQSLHVGLDKIAALLRCGRRAESALADLRKGMK